MTRSEIDQVQRALARFNALVFGLAFGFLVGGGLWLATVFLVIKGGPHPGATLGLLGEYFPGFSVTFGGAFIGFFWAFVVAFVLSYGPARIFYRGVLHMVDQTRGSGSDEALLVGTARIHVPSFSMAFGLFAGGALFLATIWLVVTAREGHEVGPHLSLLKHYLPGYGVSIPGALLGFVYLFAIGSAAFALVGTVYNRLVRSESSGSGSDQVS